MDPLDIIRKYYPSHEPAYPVLLEHSRAVARKALAIARGVSHLHPDLAFIEEAAMLHDVGILLTHAPFIGCYGDSPYICHGYLGRELLEREGLMSHALVCERHVGVGIRVTDMERQGLPLPRRDMIPLTLEEKIICFADKFYSKKMHGQAREKSLQGVRRNIARYGEEQLGYFDELNRLFSTGSFSERGPVPVP